MLSESFCFVIGVIDQQYKLPESITKLPNFAYAGSSWAYFSTSFFNPNLGNCTVIFESSPSPSRWKTMPSPYFGWRTFWPGRNPFLPLGSATGTFGTLNFFPRDAKNSAMLSIELYVLPPYCGVGILCLLGAGQLALWSSSS